MFFPYNPTRPVHLRTNLYLGIRLLRKRIDDSLRYVETINDGKTNANGSVDTEMATISVLPRRRRGVQVEISFAVFDSCVIDSCYLNRRRRRQREAAGNCKKKGEKIARHINSVSYIDKVARVVFPASFGLLNVCYWVIYVTYQEEFKWQDPPFGSISHWFDR